MLRRYDVRPDCAGTSVRGLAARRPSDRAVCRTVRPEETAVTEGGGVPPEPAVPAQPTTSRMQDAVRLLLLIDGAAEPVGSPPPPAAPDGAAGVLRTQVLLQKLDFCSATRTTS